MRGKRIYRYRITKSDIPEMPTGMEAAELAAVQLRNQLHSCNDLDRLTAREVAGA